MNLFAWKNETSASVSFPAQFEWKKEANSAKAEREFN